jgi:hypothetical protein
MNNARDDAMFDKFSTYFEMTNKTFAIGFPCALASAAGVWYLTRSALFVAPVLAIAAIELAAKVREMSNRRRTR